VINGTNLLRKDNPSWPNGDPAETIRLLAAPPLRLTAPRREPRHREPRRRVRGLAWITGLPRRVSARLFRANDVEAGWWRWQITELRGGFARSYRDARFDVLRQLYELTDPRGGTGPADERPTGEHGAPPPS
jgi:hypothetical protein